MLAEQGPIKALIDKVPPHLCQDVEAVFEVLGMRKVQGEETGKGLKGAGLEGPQMTLV